MNDSGTLPRRAQLPALIVGIIGMIVLLIALFFDAEHALRAYLFAWLFCLSIALGSMAVLMLQHLTGGTWGWLIRRPAEAAAITLPLLALLFLPIAIGASHIYPWAQPAIVSGNAHLEHRQTLFQPWFVYVRAAIYFAIWIFWAWQLRRLSLRHDRSGDPKLLGRLRVFSAAGFLVYFLSVSSAAVDWIASREVDWYSSTFGMMTITGQAAAAAAFLILVLALLRAAPPLKSVVRPNLTHDLGNLLLTLVVLWAYVTFAQYLVIWIGNTQDDNLWYYHRTHDGWAWVGTAIILLHFALPFVFLLFQQTKRNLRLLGGVAAGVLVMRAVDVLWMVAPSSLGPAPHHVSWADFVSPLAVGGVWFACFLWVLVRQPLIPQAFRVPAEPLSHEHEQGPEQQQA